MSSIAGSNRYPHVFQNTPGVDDVAYEPSCSGLTVSEFPILKDGSLMSGGRKSKQDPGTERILFNATKNANGDAITVYCGIVTHYSQNKINDLDPFRNCGRGSSTVSSSPQSTQFSTHHSTQQPTTRHSTQQQTTHGASEQHTTVQQQTTAHPTSSQPQETENPDDSEGSGGIPFPGGFPVPGGAPPGVVPGAFGNTLSQDAVFAATTTGSKAQTTQANNEPRSTGVAQTTQAVNTRPSQLSESHLTINPMAQTTSIEGQFNSQFSEPANIYATTYPITQAGGDLSISVDDPLGTYPTQETTPPMETTAPADITESDEPPLSTP
ncbi:MAG: hypothetical protein Q9214_004045 [Letrouitia sp. 1 TL-2023]